MNNLTLLFLTLGAILQFAECKIDYMHLDKLEQALRKSNKQRSDNLDKEMERLIEANRSLKPDVGDMKPNNDVEAELNKLAALETTTTCSKDDYKFVEGVFLSYQSWKYKQGSTPNSVPGIINRHLAKHAEHCEPILADKLEKDSQTNDELPGLMKMNRRLTDKLLELTERTKECKFESKTLCGLYWKSFPENFLTHLAFEIVEMAKEENRSDSSCIDDYETNYEMCGIQMMRLYDRYLIKPCGYILNDLEDTLNLADIDLQITEPSGKEALEDYYQLRFQYHVCQLFQERFLLSSPHPFVLAAIGPERREYERKLKSNNTKEEANLARNYRVKFLAKLGFKARQ